MIVVLEETLCSLGETLTPVAAWLALALSIWAATPLPGVGSFSLKRQVRRSREREFVIPSDRIDKQSGRRENGRRVLTEHKEFARREAEVKDSTTRVLTEMREAHQNFVAEIRQSIERTVTELRDSDRRGRAETREIHERIAAETRAVMAASDDRFRAQMQQTNTLLNQLSKMTERVASTEATLGGVRRAGYGAVSAPSPLGREPEAVAAQQVPADETSE
ncbi:MAG: hypothetical protein OXN89_17270 [Bryobacterales bacterium]|nr:hypothetical protein [Bryobacterales bacterium]